MRRFAAVAVSSPDSPLISVVVGVLDGAKTLETCIDSVTSQTLQRCELLVQDGGSTDGTVDILRRRERDLTYWSSGPDKGVYDAWNQVIPRCRGTWICFLGCDDALAGDGVLERLAEAALRDEPDLVASKVAITDAHGRVRRVVGKPWDWTAMKRRPIVAHPGLLHHRRIFARDGLYNPSYKIAGDYELLLRLPRTTTASFVDQVTVMMAGTGMSHRQEGRGIREGFRARWRSPAVGPISASLTFGYEMSRLVAKRLLRM